MSQFQIRVAVLFLTCTAFQGRLCRNTEMFRLQGDIFKCLHRSMFTGFRQGVEIKPNVTTGAGLYRTPLAAVCWFSFLLKTLKLGRIVPSKHHIVMRIDEETSTTRWVNEWPPWAIPRGSIQHYKRHIIPRGSGTGLLGDSRARKGCCWKRPHL